MKPTQQETQEALEIAAQVFALSHGPWAHHQTLQKVLGVLQRATQPENTEEAIP